MDPGHVPPKVDAATLEKKRKRNKTPSCVYRLPPGELLFNNETAVPEGFEPEDNLDVRNFYRKAAEIHKKVRMYAREQIKPGVSLLDASDKIEAYLREMCGNETYQTVNMTGVKSKGHEYYCGQAFPLGLSVNGCAAHYAPLEGDDHIVSEKDIVKVDFGIHCNGYLVDSAFSMHWDPELDPIVDASREATNAAIKHAGVDVRLSELGAVIDEIISAHEYKGRHLSPVRNLSGHLVERYTIHAGKSIPLYNTHEKDVMLEGEVYACETFASTGKGMIHDEQPTSHYMVDKQAAQMSSKLITGTDKTKELFNILKQNFHTLAWNPRWLKGLGIESYQLQLQSLVRNGYVNDYPKLCDQSKSYVSQFEHTFMVGEWGKEVFSRGDDY